MSQKKTGIKSLHIALVVLLLIAIGGIGLYSWQARAPKEPQGGATDGRLISNFDDCVAAGNPVMESFPEQCSANGQTFTNTSQQTPGSTGVQDEDNLAIKRAILGYCTALGVQTTSEAIDAIDNNMKDPNLYVKEGNFARLSARCGDEGGFRSFLQKKNDVWSILGQGQMNTIGCETLDGTGIPASVVTTCFDENGEERPIK